MNPQILKFDTFQNAIAYRARCPLCSGFMRINDRNLAEDYDEYHYPGREIKFHLTPWSNDLVSINPMTDEVRIIYAKSLDYMADGELTSKPITLESYSGLHKNGIQLDCISCCRYDFCLSIELDLTSEKLLDLSLSVESFSIESEDQVSSVTNFYFKNKTKYEYFKKNGDEHEAYLPLITLNLQDPKETINRLQKLLIFT